SEPGVGSTFYAILPIRYQGPSERTIEGPDAKDAILVIDNDEIARYLLSGLLKEMGYTVLEASNAIDGIQKAKNKRPRAAFIDLTMPQHDGFWTVERFREDEGTKAIPVIIYTSKTLTERERERL